MSPEPFGGRAGTPNNKSKFSNNDSPVRASSLTLIDLAGTYNYLILL